MEPKYKRVLLKLSGEHLGGVQGDRFDFQVIQEVTEQIVAVHNLGVELALVVGGGNIFRGVQSSQLKMERVTADHMGMLATIINSLCLQESLERQGKKTRVMTGIEIRDVAEPYVKRRAVRHLEKGRIVIFGGGTGNPYFSTDTAAVLRGAEVQVEIVVKGTKVDGVYDKDPVLHSDAKKIDKLTFTEALERNVKVMDSTAITFCRDNDLPIRVLNISKPNGFMDCVMGKSTGTYVSNS